MNGRGRAAFRCERNRRMLRDFHKDLARRGFLKRAAGTLIAAPVASSIARRAAAQQPGKETAPAAAAKPSKPTPVLNVRDLGATGDGTTKDTAALQQAIDRCSVLGGGEALIPAGNYLTGALALRSNTILRLQKKPTIFGPPDF